MRAIRNHRPREVPTMNNSRTLGDHSFSRLSPGATPCLGWRVSTDRAALGLCMTPPPVLSRETSCADGRVLVDSAEQGINDNRKAPLRWEGVAGRLIWRRPMRRGRQDSGVYPRAALLRR